MGQPVEIEFAVNISCKSGEKQEFGVLQMKPLVVNEELNECNLEEIDENSVICKSDEVLGNGTINDITDIIFVNIEKFTRATSRQVAQEVSQFNLKLLSEKRPYLLIGIGRWGTLDPWLGIPVTWSQISGAKAIVEAGLSDMYVEPSQGSHFFQNLTSFSVGYFTVNTDNKNNFVDWDWLIKQIPEERKDFVSHIKFEKPFSIQMNSHKNCGIIYKPNSH